MSGHRAFGATAPRLRTASRSLLLASLAAGLAPALVTPAFAEEGPEAFRGKTVTVAIGSGTGGSHDQWGRLINRHMGKHLPGNPTLVPKNFPGAGGMALANTLWAQSPKDGTIFGIVNRTIYLEPLFAGEKSKAQFDPRKFSWIGSSDTIVSVAIAWHTSPVKTWKDLYDHDLIVGAVGAASGTTKEAYVMKNLLGFRYRVIMGYPGGNDVDLAMERGEIEGRANLAYSGLKSRNSQQLAEGKIRVLYQMGVEKHPEMPNVPSVLDMARNDEERRLLELNFMHSDIGYSFAAPPDLPAARLATLRKAFKATLEDSQLNDEAAKQQLDITYVPGERLQGLMEKAYAAPPQMIARLLDLSQLTLREDLAEANVVKTKITGIAREGRLVSFIDKGNKTEAAVSGGTTEIMRAGQKMEASALKEGMTCEITYYGNKGTAAKIACE
jgi:tripartite-type tricarboxylate transporter receptor subunit TctC